MLDKNYLRWGLYGGLVLVIVALISYLLAVNYGNFGIFNLILGMSPIIPGITFIKLVGLDNFYFFGISIVALFSALFYFLLGFLLGLIARKLYLRYNE